MSDYQGDIWNMWDKDSEINMKWKRAKDSKADETLSKQHQMSRNGTSTGANGKGALFRVHPYHKSCDTSGKNKFLLIWKVRKGAIWDDE